MIEKDPVNIFLIAGIFSFISFLNINYLGELGFIGFDISLNYVKLLEALFLVFIFYFFLNDSIKKPSDFFVGLNFLIILIPMSCLYWAQDLSREFIYMAFFGSFLILCVARFFESPKIEIRLFSEEFFVFLLLSVVLIGLLLVIQLVGISSLNFDFSLVYELREDVDEKLSVLGLLGSILPNILVPFLLVMCIKNKKYFYTILTTIVSILLFALTTHKGSIFFPIIIFSFIAMSKYLNKSFYIYSFLIILLFVFLISFLLGGIYVWISSLLFRRAIMIPAILNFEYYDFFSENDFSFWSHNSFTFDFLYYPYNSPPQEIIGNEFSGTYEMYANTGWIGAGYMQAGFLGIMIYAFLIGLLFSFVDSLTNKLNETFIIALLLVPFYILLSSSDLPTAFLSHGILLFIVLICLIKTVK